jgi:hypothetical protein
MDPNEPKVQPAHVAIVSPKGEVLNKKPKPATYGPDGQRIRPPGDFMKGMPTREELVNHLAAGIAEVGEKMYEQLSGETATYLEEMEQSIFERVMRELEARSLRGRLRQWWWKVHPPKLIVSIPEATTAAIEAMDPNVAETEYIPVDDAALRRGAQSLKDALEDPDL